MWPLVHPQLQRKESRGGRMEQHIHFWLGAQSSQDEAGVAAFKSVELDEYLGGGPIQSRDIDCIRRSIDLGMVYQY